ncbi:EboA domain-containing protein [Siccirubricoccus sp. G192]|uniref:EboA domain-containing protein n=1 Tax=Siccirubricoccus sp. G192 TaxID=2849651 RepID=UPI001C2C6862|nr:EboA domain-containing protein [Siccirubricoccus sp. G192]MBV1795690.1 EboA domain-containing protein [Siccirubricoccus sp. G192]
MTAWLQAQLPPDAQSWLADQCTRLEAGASAREFNLAISLVPRRLGKADLVLDAAALAAAEVARPGWDPRGWSLDQAGRLVLLLAGGGQGPEFADRLRQLFATADIAEMIAFYRGLPLYPDPERHEARAREGVRSGMKPIFEAVAHRNPYPAESFDENAWNHMVLKALFIGSALAPIQGLDRRANPTLARMLCDYAHERRAAGRPVGPELWRCVGPHADDAALDDLAAALRSADVAEREAAALALAACPAPRARELLAQEPGLAAAIETGRLAQPGDTAR